MVALAFLLALVVLAVAVVTAFGHTEEARALAPRLAGGLRVTTFAVTAVTTVFLVPAAFGDAGLGRLVVIVVPVVVTAVPVFLKATPSRLGRVSWAVAALLILFVLVTVLSVGRFYTPTAMLALAAAVASRDVTARTHRRH